MGKPRMSNIWEKADRRGKRRKIWDSGSHTRYMWGTFDTRFLEFGLGSFGAFCKISDSTIFETLLLRQFSSEFNQT